MTPNASYENTRVANSEIDCRERGRPENVTWTQPLTGAGTFGAFASTPLISEDGVTYVQEDLASNVMAYDLETGEQLWKVGYDAPRARAERPRPRGRSPLRRHQRRRVRARRRVRRGGLEEAGPRVRLRGRGGPEPRLTIQPAVRDGVLHLSEAAKAGGGRALAFDARRRAEQFWSFDTTDEPQGDDTASGGA